MADSTLKQPLTLIPYDFNGQELRAVVDKSGEYWFVAMDVSNILDYTDPHIMNKKLDGDEVIIRQLNGITTRKFSLISLSGLYSVIFSCTKPEAKEFKRWVTQDLLIAIRKIGLYDDISTDDRYAMEDRKDKLVRMLLKHQPIDIAEPVYKRIEKICNQLREPIPAHIKGNVSVLRVKSKELTIFCSAYNTLVKMGVPVDHSTDCDIIAIHLDSFISLALKHNLVLPKKSGLKKVLTIIPGFKQCSVRSVIENHSVWCWTFTNEGYWSVCHD